MGVSPPPLLPFFVCAELPASFNTVLYKKLRMGEGRQLAQLRQRVGGGEESLFLPQLQIPSSVSLSLPQISEL